MDNPKEALAADLFNGKIVLTCEKHPHYHGEGRPTKGCPGCWKVYYMLYFRKVPPEKRKEAIEELYAIVRHMTEEIKAGKFDFVPFAHPKIETLHEN